MSAAYRLDLEMNGTEISASHSFVSQSRVVCLN